MQFSDVGDLPGIEVEIVECLLLTIFGTLEFLTGGVPVAKARARAKPKGMATMGREVEIQHNGNGGKVLRQFVLFIIDGIQIGRAHV